MGTERWHVAFTDGGTEQKTCGEIRALGFGVYVPMERHKRFRRGVRLFIELPLFPCYLFARFDSADAKWNEIRDCDGVRDVLCNLQKPVAIPIGFVEKLQRMQALGLFDKTKAPNPFPPGTDVMLDDDGPFAEFVGKVMRARTADRVDLLISYLGRELTVNVSLARLSSI